MIKKLVELLLARGIEVALYNLATSDIGEIAKDLVDSRALILGTPALLGGMHPLAIYGVHLIRALRPPIKYAVILSSYGWGGGAKRQALELLAPTKIEIIGELEINGPPTKHDYEKIMEIGKELIEKVRENR